MDNPNRPFNRYPPGGAIRTSPHINLNPTNLKHPLPPKPAHSRPDPDKHDAYVVSPSPIPSRSPSPVPLSVRLGRQQGEQRRGSGGGVQPLRRASQGHSDRDRNMMDRSVAGPESNSSRRASPSSTQTTTKTLAQRIGPPLPSASKDPASHIITINRPGSQQPTPSTNNANPTPNPSNPKPATTQPLGTMPALFTSTTPTVSTSSMPSTPSSTQQPPKTNRPNVYLPSYIPPPAERPITKANVDAPQPPSRTTSDPNSNSNTKSKSVRPQAPFSFTTTTSSSALAPSNSSSTSTSTSAPGPPPTSTPAYPPAPTFLPPPPARSPSPSALDLLARQSNTSTSANTGTSTNTGTTSNTSTGAGAGTSMDPPPAQTAAVDGSRFREWERAVVEKRKMKLKLKINLKVQDLGSQSEVGKEKEKEKEKEKGMEKEKEKGKGKGKGNDVERPSGVGSCALSEKDKERERGKGGGEERSTTPSSTRQADREPSTGGKEKAALIPTGPSSSRKKDGAGERGRQSSSSSARETEREKSGAPAPAASTTASGSVTELNRVSIRDKQEGMGRRGMEGEKELPSGPRAGRAASSSSSVQAQGISRTSSGIDGRRNEAVTREARASSRESVQRESSRTPASTAGKEKGGVVPSGPKRDRQSQRSLSTRERANDKDEDRERDRDRERATDRARVREREKDHIPLDETAAARPAPQQSLASWSARSQTAADERISNATLLQAPREPRSDRERNIPVPQGRGTPAIATRDVSDGVVPSSQTPDPLPRRKASQDVQPDTVTSTPTPSRVSASDSLRHAALLDGREKRLADKTVEDGRIRSTPLTGGNGSAVAGGTTELKAWIARKAGGLAASATGADKASSSSIPSPFKAPANPSNTAFQTPVSAQPQIPSAVAVSKTLTPATTATERTGAAQASSASSTAASQPVNAKTASSGEAVLPPFTFRAGAEANLFRKPAERETSNAQVAVENGMAKRKRDAGLNEGAEVREAKRHHSREPESTAEGAGSTATRSTLNNGEMVNGRAGTPSKGTAGSRKQSPATPSQGAQVESRLDDRTQPDVIDLISDSDESVEQPSDVSDDFVITAARLVSDAEPGPQDADQIEGPSQSQARVAADAGLAAGGPMSGEEDGRSGGIEQPSLARHRDPSTNAVRDAEIEATVEGMDIDAVVDDVPELTAIKGGEGPVCDAAGDVDMIDVNGETADTKADVAAEEALQRKAMAFKAMGQKCPMLIPSDIMEDDIAELLEDPQLVEGLEGAMIALSAAQEAKMAAALEAEAAGMEVWRLAARRSYSEKIPRVGRRQKPVARKRGEGMDSFVMMTSNVN